jgi:exopolyphosphatase/guanosine-5'-triphosphate,3'-diphosphate pyrophosphatase
MKRSWRLLLGGRAGHAVARVAAIDCGTNSIRLLIAEVGSGDYFREIFRDMKIVRLGEGVDTKGEFLPAAVDRTLKALEEFNLEIRRRGVEKIRFCATSATRDAKNREIFIDGVRDILGIEPEVISGAQEAELSFIGATRSLDSDLAPFLVVDIGGGSTEFVYGYQGVEASISVNIGCVRMAERHLKDSPVDPVALELAIRDIDKAIAQAAKEVPILGVKTLVAVAGTATTVAAAALELESYDRDVIHLSRIPAQLVHKVTLSFQNSTKEQIAALGYMHPGRVDVITAGSLILSRIMTATDQSEFIASESDILDGIAFSLQSDN